MSDTEKNPEEEKKDSTLKVEIVSHVSLLEILSDNKKVFKIMIALLVLVLTIFIGLAIVTISIKSFYPYNEIKVNAFGATTMQNEDVEITYWLFNTADLWANSGIHVEAGDKLTIRASGKSHTAIHHLVEAAQINAILEDKWSGTDGEIKTSKKDLLRTNYRIFKEHKQDALLMQVIPDKVSDKILKRNDNDFNYVNDYFVVSQKNKDNVYFIGKEQIDLIIYESGILHFAVNDVVLTESIIKAMIRENNDSIIKAVGYKDNDEEKDSTSFSDYIIKNKIPDKKEDTITFDRAWRKKNKDFLDFGRYPDKDSCRSNHNEMTYYLEKNYYNAWFDDNVGSFLIVVERKKNK